MTSEEGTEGFDDLKETTPLPSTTNTTLKTNNSKRVQPLIPRFRIIQYNKEDKVSDPFGITLYSDFRLCRDSVY